MVAHLDRLGRLGRLDNQVIKVHQQELMAELLVML
jgi:hypothetical protein